MLAFTEDIHINDENIRKNQSTINVIKQELKQKQKDLHELQKIEQDKTNVYGTWMNDCLKAIDNDNRFHKKPIGPIGRYIRCINPRWCYAVEKHLGPVMSSFICSDNHDESILLEIFSQYVRDSRPTISVRKYSEKPHDISGTLQRVQQANLLSIYQVLKIDDITVECLLIDNRQIEATILLDDLPHAKSVQQSGVLRWERVDKRVKQVAEAWTYDGSNIKLDKAFRIYTNDRQPTRYFTTNNTQALSMNEINNDIQRLNEQINQMNLSINQLQKIRQTTKEDYEKIKQKIIENKKKIKELDKEIDKFNSTMPIPCAYSLDELKEKLNENYRLHHSINQKFDEQKENKEIKHQHLADIKQKLENIVKKVESKANECEALNEKIDDEKTERQDIQQQIPKLMKKFTQLNEDILKCQERINELTKNKPKVSKINSISS